MKIETFELDFEDAHTITGEIFGIYYPEIETVWFSPVEAEDLKELLRRYREDPDAVEESEVQGAYLVKMSAVRV